MNRLSAPWIWTGRRLIERGAVLLDRRGRIAAVGTDAEVPAPPGGASLSLSGVALLPGLVNTHTHLELTGFDHLVEDADFADWILHLVRLKRERTAAEFLEAARAGLRQCHAAGVTTVADTGDSDAVWRVLSEQDGSGIAYLEVFGQHPDDASGSLAGLQARVAEARAAAGGRVRIGVSPHAPYTVSGALYQAVSRWAEEQDLPVAVHIAESEAESEFLARGEGVFARRWIERGFPLPQAGCSPLNWLERHGVLGRRTLCIHTIRAGDEDIGRLVRSGSAVAHCPRSNRRHRHGDAPLSRLLEAGIPLGVGTDSVASVAPLDLLAEARASRRLGSLGAADALRLVTVEAARALGLEGELGSLEVGKWGDLAAIALPQGTGAGQLEEAVLGSGPGDVRLTILGGRTVFRG